MLELGIGADIFRSVGLIFWLLVAGALVAAIWLPQGKKDKLIAMTFVLGLFLVFPGRWGWEEYQRVKPIKERLAKGKTLYQEKCKSVAGEKIYKTVPDVEGVLLLQVPAPHNSKNYTDPLWPGAAFASEAKGDDYLTTFLGYEHSSSPTGAPVSKDFRGYIGTHVQASNPSNLPGYRYVDVIDEKDGKRYRYTGSEKIVGKKDTNAPGVRMELEKNPNYDLNVYSWTLDKTPAPDPAPRYAVALEGHVIPEERAVWVASATVKVIDLQTKEVLGEMTRYAWASGVVSTQYPHPWMTARKCPVHTGSSGSVTRMFVDQILLPKKDQ